MVDLEPHSLGVVLPVKAQPGAKRSGVCGDQNGMLKVSVPQVAEQGKANQALRAVLSKSLDVRKSQLELISGATSRTKRFLVRGIGRDELARRIAVLLGDAGQADS